MTPTLYIALGLFFIASGGFVIFQGLRARKMGAGPWPKFFLVAFVVHIAIAVLGLYLLGTGLLALNGR